MRSKGIKLQDWGNGEGLLTQVVRQRPDLDSYGTERSLACLLPVIFCLSLSSCSVTQSPVSVFDRAPASQRSSAASTENVKTYTVQRGDTLYGIALNNGLAYKDLAEWNSIGNPNAIDVGQQLSLSPPPRICAAFSISIIPDCTINGQRGPHSQGGYGVKREI